MRHRSIRWYAVTAIIVRPRSCRSACGFLREEQNAHNQYSTRVERSYRQFQVIGPRRLRTTGRNYSMTFSTPENQIAMHGTKLLVKSAFSLVLCISTAVCADAQNAQPNSTDQSWTSTTQTSVDHTSPCGRRRAMWSPATALSINAEWKCLDPMASSSPIPTPKRRLFE